MTYDLAVWEGDPPADRAAARVEFERLYARYIGSGHHFEPAARIAGYVRALLDRFPDIGSDEGADNPWAGGSLMSMVRGPLLCIPIVSGRADEISVWAVQLAGVHGLNCYDPRLNQLRLPVDRLPEPVVDSRVLRDAAVQRLTGLLLEVGWETARSSCTEPAFAQLQPTGLVFSFRPNPSIRFGEVTFSPTVGTGHRELGRLCNEFMGRPPSAGSPGALGTAVDLGSLLYADGLSAASFTRWRVSSEDEVDTGTAVLLEDLAGDGMPFMQRFASLGDIIAWTYVNRGYQARDGILAVACALDGREAEAAEVIGDYAAYGTDQVGRLLEQTTRFVQNFVGHFGIGEDALRRLSST
ncbi:hypothetical protein [Actinoplanes flavus]|uniref:Uncharacterized protein n=1 Tax=Actinoplanes flavus TaxID=2820290 RepID=A0ABS3V045_9ACTN|nr:hypothetical protein [Actinoplanes flavus]MBO3744205.1 hypothetical protein [Actinoplanes flavus]